MKQTKAILESLSRKIIIDEGTHISVTLSDNVHETRLVISIPIGGQFLSFALDDTDMGRNPLDIVSDILEQGKTLLNGRTRD